MLVEYLLFCFEVLLSSAASLPFPKMILSEKDVKKIFPQNNDKIISNLVTRSIGSDYMTFRKQDAVNFNVGYKQLVNSDHMEIKFVADHFVMFRR